MTYTVFTRNWWKENPAWPNGLEPDSNATKTTIAKVTTERDARAICQEYNETYNSGRLSKKAEYRED